MIVDIHAHFLPPTLLEEVRRGSGPANMALRSRAGPDDDPGVMWVHGSLEYPLDQHLIDVPTRLKALDRIGIDAAVVSVAPDLYLYDFSPAETAEVCRIANDDLASMIAEAKGRLYGFVSVPLNDPALAVAELLRMASVPGIVGAAIGTSVGDRMLDDSSFDQFYSTLAKLEMPVLLHPLLEGIDRARLVCDGFDQYFLDNVIGNPLETCRAVSRLIAGGVFDRHPALTVQLLHGGGHFIYQLGRMEHAFEVDVLARGKATKPPSAYLDNLLIDTIVYRRRALEFLIQTAGATRVTFGTDLPFAMADTTALTTRDGIAPEWRDAVLGLNAVRAYRLSRS